MHRLTAPYVALVLAGALLVSAFVLHDARYRHSGARVGARLAALDVVGLDGANRALDSERGTIVYNVFTTWCPQCRDEIPELRRAQARLAARGDRLVGIDQAENAATVAAFVARAQIRYPVFIDASSRSAVTLGARVVPTTVIVRDGVVRRILAGPLQASELLAIVRTVDE